MALALSVAPMVGALIAPCSQRAVNSQRRAPASSMALDYEPSYEDGFYEEWRTRDSAKSVENGLFEEQLPSFDEDFVEDAPTDVPFHHGLQTADVKFGQADEVLADNPSWREEGHLWVLLFGSGESEGIYTLRHPQDTEHFVVAFEDADEASRFAMLLEAEDFELPRSEPWPGELLSEFCTSTGLSIGLVLHGELVMPPSQNQWTPAEQLPTTLHVKSLERIFNMEEITSPEIHRQLQRMYAMRRPRMEEDTAVNWPQSWNGNGDAH